MVLVAGSCCLFSHRRPHFWQQRSQLVSPFVLRSVYRVNRCWEYYSGKLTHKVNYYRDVGYSSIHLIQAFNQLLRLPFLQSFRIR
jgi:hypothetical protein